MRIFHARRSRQNGLRQPELEGTMRCIKGHVGNKFHLESAACFYYFSVLIAES
jgi:hypothetical protein